MRLDLSSTWTQRLDQDLPAYLQRRATLSYGPLWKLSVEAAETNLAGGESATLLPLPDEQLAAVRSDFDKLIVLVIERRHMEFTASAQEYDCLLERWGPVRRSLTFDATSVPELAFDVIGDAFTPMATFRVIRETPENVELKFRGAELVGQAYPAAFGEPGQVLQPLLRRVDREGQPVEDGIQNVPWTYFEVNSPTDGLQTATIVSHTQSPLGIRQRGRVDQLAALVRPNETQTRLRLFARDQARAGAGRLSCLSTRHQQRGAGVYRQDRRRWRDWRRAGHDADSSRVCTEWWSVDC